MLGRLERVCWRGLQAACGRAEEEASMDDLQSSMAGCGVLCCVVWMQSGFAAEGDGSDSRHGQKIMAGPPWR